MTIRLMLLTAAVLLISSCDTAKRNANGTSGSAVSVTNAADEAAIAQMYTADGAVMPPNGPIGKGQAAIQQTWASMMNMPGFELTFVPEQIVLSGSADMALDRGTYRLAVAPAGKAQSDTGKYVVVWRKVGGEWKAAADIFNSDLPIGGN